MKKYHLIPNFVSLSLLSSAALLAIRDGLLLEWWSIPEIAAISVAAALCVTCFCCRKATAAGGLLLGAVVELCIVFFRYKDLQLEFLKCYYHVIPLVNRYYWTNFSEWNPMISTPSESLTLLIVLILFLGLWMGAGFVYRRWRIISLLPLIPAFVCGFLLGYAPGTGATACLVGGLGIRMIFQKNKALGRERRAVGTAFLCLCAAMGLSGLLYRPVADKLLTKHESLQAYQHSLEDKVIALVKNGNFFSDLVWNLGVRSDYARLSNKPPGLSDEEIFTITLGHRPSEPLYVRNFVGAYYENGLWYPASEDNLVDYVSQKMDDIAVSMQTMDPKTYAQSLGEAVQTRFYDNMRSVGPEEQVTIQVRKRSGNLDPQPYYSNLPEQAEIIGDVGFRITSRIYQFSMYTRENTTFEIKNNLTETIYWKFIQKEYTQVPEKLGEKLRNGGEELWKAMRREYTYSLELDPVPEGEDIVEYFLFQQKKGYCMHFASAGTLYLRSQGTPARYASGYIVTPGDFRENEDGTFTAVVTGQRAHAWVEIYAKRLGWYPEEVTPAAYFEGVRGAESGESAQNIIDRTTPEEPENPAGDTETKNDPKKDPLQPENTPVEEQPKEPDENTGLNGKDGVGGDNGETSDSAARRIPGTAVQTAGMILLLTAVILTIFLRRKIILKRRGRNFHDADTRKGAASILKETFRLLKLAGICLSGNEDEMVFAGETEKKLACFAEGEFVRFIETARIVRYGNEEITEEQREYLYMIYMRLMLYVRKRLNRWQRVWYRYGQILF